VGWGCPSFPNLDLMGLGVDMGGEMDSRFGMRYQHVIPPIRIDIGFLHEA
jgi:hypothetical protein